MIKKVIAAAIITVVAGSQADAAVFNGFAIGANGGVLFAQNKISHRVTGLPKIKSANKTLGIFGIQFDYEMSKANALYSRVGLLVSAPTGKATSTTKMPGGGTLHLSAKNSVMTELNGALGYNFCNDVVAYGLAGLSLSKKTYDIKITGFNKATKSKTQLSAVVGAGLMKKVTDKISAGIEYKHTFEPGLKIKSNGQTFGKIKSGSDSILARVSYHF